MRLTLMAAVTAVMLPLATPSHAPARAVSCDSTRAAVGAEIATTEARKGCGHGIKPCSANQVGLPCNPNNPGIICSAQANGSYCCLAYAP